MDDQGGAPQQAPDVIALAEMGVLVGQHVAEHGRVRRSLWGDVHRRADNAKQAGGGQPRRHIHRQRTVRPLQRDAPLPQPHIKPQVGRQQHQRRQSGPRQPRPAQPGGQCAQIRGGWGLQRVRRRGRAEGGWCTSRLHVRHRQAGYPRRRGGGRGRELRHTALHPRFHRPPCPGDGGVKQLHRHQQPQQHHRPQGVAHTGADAPAQRGAQGQYH